MFGKEAWSRYDGWAKSPAPPQAGQWFGLLGGTAFSLALYGLRAVLPGFPLHPVGYALSSSWGMLMVWFPMFLAWGIKVVLLRFGGLGTYRKVLPFVFGVIVGECLAGSVWNLLGILTDIPTYDFNP